MDSFRYHKRGVSSDKSEVHKAIAHHDKGLYPNSFCKILPDIFTNNSDLCSIVHADTVGTKGVLSYLYWKETGSLEHWKYLSQDAMVMNIDDMLCSGCTGPFTISSTIGRNSSKIDGEVLSAIIAGNQDFIEFLNNMGLEAYSAGGETADVGDVVRTIDTGITASSIFNRADVIEVDLKPGDIIVGLASYGQSSYEDNYNSGISCNGLTSARHDLLSKYYKSQYPESYCDSLDEELLYSGPFRLTDEVPIDAQKMLIGDLLTAPTRTFAPVLKKVFDQCDRLDISGVIHNTGGAHTKVLKFANGHRVIKDNLLDIPPVFRLIQSASKTTDREMFQIFNMGTRLELYCRSEDIAKQVIASANKYKVRADIIGQVEEGETGKSEVIIHHNNEYLHYS